MSALTVIVPCTSVGKEKRDLEMAVREEMGRPSWLSFRAEDMVLFGCCVRMVLTSRM